MRDIIKNTLMMTALTVLTACNNSVEEVSRLPSVIPPPVPRVSVALDADLQELLTRDNQVTVRLRQDGNEAQALTIDGATATLTLPGEDMQGEHQYYIGVYYTSAKITDEVLVAEGEKTASGMQQVPFETGDLKTIPYDKDNSNVIEEAEQIILDIDKDGKSNLAEILEKGNPLSPEPTFLSLAQVQVPEKQPNSSPPPQLYTVYTAEALSPRDNATIAYSIVGGANQDRFDINADTGELSFVVDANGKWPVYTLTTSNDYLVDIRAFDGTLSSTLSLTVSVTDVFNLSVTVGIKSLQFTWFAVPSAKYYKLRENPDGNSRFTEVAGADNITGLNFDLSISLYRFDQLNARFILEAYSETKLLKTSQELSINDSLLAAVGFLKAPNAGADDYFGYSVSLSADGGTLAVGAIGESSAAIADGIDTSGNFVTNDCIGNCQLFSGAVYLFEKRRGNPNIWDAGDFAAFFKAPNASAGDSFGSSVSLSADGGVLAVGADGESNLAIASGIDISGSLITSDCDAVGVKTNCLFSSGAVYLFEKGRGTDSTNWDAGDFTAFFKAPNASSRDFFGNSVSLSADGGTLAVGASSESSAAIADGIDISGSPKDIDCDVTGVKTNCQLYSGAVYLFEKGRGTDPNNWDAGQWGTVKGDFVAFFKAPNAGKSDQFGFSVSLSADGGTLAVGAYRESSAAIAGGIDTSSSPKDNDCAVTGVKTNCQLNSGAVYLFEKGRGTDPANWDLGDFAAFVKAPNAGEGDRFGRSVSLSADGGVLAVGAYLESSLAITGGIDTSGNPMTSDCVKGPNCLGWSGAVYLFEKGRGADPANWDAGQPGTVKGDFAAFFKAPNAGEGGAGDRFGFSVSLSADGGTLAVGALYESSATIAGGVDISGSPKDNDCAVTGVKTNCQLNSGAAYLFEKGRGTDSANWDLGDFAAFVKAPNAGVGDKYGRGDKFGNSVSLSANGGTLAVGAYQESSAAIAGGIDTSGSPRDSDCAVGGFKTNCQQSAGAVYLY